MHLVLAARLAEGKTTQKHAEQDNARRPDISRLTTVGKMRSNLWSHIMRAATGGKESILVMKRGHAEVTYLEVAVGVEEKIFRLDIAMTNSKLVAAFQAREELSIETNRLFLSEGSAAKKHAIDLATVYELLYNVSVKVSTTDIAAEERCTYISPRFSQTS